MGKGTLKIFDYDTPVNVMGYDPSMGSTQYNIISGVVGYVHPYTGIKYHLVVHQVVHIPELEHHLLCPMQCRANNVTVNDCPRIHCADPNEESHSIVATDDDDETVVIPFHLRGVTSQFTVDTVPREEFERHECPRIELTNKDLIWNPSSSVYEDQENAMLDRKGDIVRPNVTARGPLMSINSICVSTNSGAADIAADDNLANVLASQVNVTYDECVSKSDNNVCSASVSEFKTGDFQSRRRKLISGDTLAKRWNIDRRKARNTVKATTQRGIRTVLHPALTRRYPTNDRMLRYNRLPHDVFTDTMFAGVRSMRSNKCAQVYCSQYGWSRFHPMKSKGEAHESLSLLFKRDGVPPKICCDNAKEQALGRFAAKCRETDCHLVTTEPYSPWMNAAEGCVKHIKQGSSRKMLISGTPRRLWDDCGEYESLVRSHTALDIYGLFGQVPETIMMGKTADISFLAEFEWFQWLMFYEPEVDYPDGHPTIGRWLGPAIDVGNAMTHKVLKANGETIFRSTVRAWNQEEEDNPVLMQQRKDFMDSIKDTCGPRAKPQDFPKDALTPEFEYYADDSQQEEGFEGTPDEILPPTPEFGDNYVGARVLLPRAGGMDNATVRKRSRGNDGNPIGRANDNPILDTRQYVVEFEDGHQAELTANVIAQNMYAQCDPDGHQHVIFESIVGVRRSSTALCHADQIQMREGRPGTWMRRSTKGWKLCVQWKDGSTSWEKLSDMKESHPVEVAEYAVAQDLELEPAFNWWVPHVLKKRERIISKIKLRSSKYLKKWQKYGIRIPKNVDDARELDKKNGNTLWMDAIAKEMENVKVAFDIKDNPKDVPRGYQHVKCHMIFDVKMENFRRKARLVAGGHMTQAPAAMTYASVVSRETVRIALTLAALNDLDVKCGDVLNAYITAPVTEKIYTVLGDEFGADSGKTAIIVRALYGLKSSGAAFRKHLADCMTSMNYKPCLADPDLWMKAEVRANGDKYYSYILNYVDDILVVHDDARSVLDRIDKYMKLKPDSVGDPDIYLGAKVKRVKVENGVWCWSISPSKYIQESVRNCENHLKSNFDGKYSFTTNAPNPFAMGYDPDTDVTPELNPEEASYYNSIIGMMRWMVELGRIDINTEISQLSTFLAMPRMGHLEAAVHVMSYLKIKHNSRLVLDPSYATIEYRKFKQDEDWTAFYGDVEEALPPNAPEPLGKEVELRGFVDSDHAGDKRTRRSRTGYLIYMNMALVNWCSKKQTTVECAVFGAEFVAMRTLIETLRGIRYKLRMMGVEVTGPSYIYGDNMSVINNTSKPESILKKKSNSICYHFVREAVAMKEALTAHIPTLENVADLFTKVLYGGKRRNLVKQLLYDIYDYE